MWRCSILFILLHIALATASFSGPPLAEEDLTTALKDASRSVAVSGWAPAEQMAETADSRLQHASINVGNVEGWQKAHILAEAASTVQKEAPTSDASLHDLVERDIVRDVAQDTARKVRQAASGNIAQVLASARIRFKAREIQRKALRVQRRISRNPEVTASLRPTRPRPLAPLPTLAPEPSEPLAPASAGDTLTQGVAALRAGGAMLRWLDRELRVGDSDLDLTSQTVQAKAVNKLQTHTAQLNRRVRKMSAALAKARSRLAKVQKTTEAVSGKA